MAADTHHHAADTPGVAAQIENDTVHVAQCVQRLIELRHDQRQPDVEGDQPDRHIDVRLQALALEEGAQWRQVAEFRECPLRGGALQGEQQLVVVGIPKTDRDLAPGVAAEKTIRGTLRQRSGFAPVDLFQDNGKPVIEIHVADRTDHPAGMYPCRRRRAVRCNARNHEHVVDQDRVETGFAAAAAVVG